MDITLKRGNVIRMTDSEDRAKVLEEEGYQRLSEGKEKEAAPEGTPAASPAALDDTSFPEAPSDSGEEAPAENSRGKKSRKE